MNQGVAVVPVVTTELRKANSIPLAEMIFFDSKVEVRETCDET